MRCETFWDSNDTGRSHGIVDHTTSLISVVTHRNVVRMIVNMNIGNGKPELIFLGRVKCYTVGGLRHVFTHQPHTGDVFIRLHNSRVFAAPPTEIGVGSHVASEERQAEVHYLHIIATDEIAIRFVISLVLNPARHCDPAVHSHGFVEYGPHSATRVTHVVSSNLSRRVR